MYSLTTERLLLAPFTAGDLDELIPLYAEVDFWRYPLGRGMTAEETAGFIERASQRYESDGTGVLAVRLAATGELAGWAGLAVPHFLPEVLPAVEVGWRLARRFWGHGYATEAGRAALAHGFSALALDRVVSIFQPDNVASGAVMARLGLMFDRHTVHPVSGVELEVRAISRETWRDCAAR